MDGKKIKRKPRRLQSPLRLLKMGRLHTELVKCGSDVEYVAKVHCLRQAYSRLFTLPGAATWIVDIGRQVISDLIVYADRVCIVKYFYSVI
ncbi:hypothetical protein G9C98_007621 [Cotesia typhae]|uniref:Uncharacterized protein n=1 Tax=Cotesia typhae TaxID=2053667 RepID=A0A8J5USY9_9HYME|nr:hypothetical protein G9C98_007621 [Cotesia typhae]